MKEYTYKFADGSKSTVEVPDEIYDILIEMDKQEKYGNRRETRRHISLESLMEQGLEPSIIDDYFAEARVINMNNERLQEGIKQLLPAQQELLYKVYVDQLTVTEIAKSECVAVCSVSKRLGRIHKKLESFL